MANRISESSTSERTSIYPPFQVSFLDLTPTDASSTLAETCQGRKLHTLRQRGGGNRPKTTGKNKSSSTICNSRASTDESTASCNSYTDFQDWSFNTSSRSFVSTSSSSSGNISPRSTSPVYEAPPPITPAYLRYYRAESKRADEHYFGSVASRGTDIAPEARWEARMLDLQRREEAEKAERERVDREASTRKVGFWKTRRLS